MRDNPNESTGQQQPEGVPTTISLHLAGHHYEQRQGTNYPMEPAYIKMVQAQLREAFYSGAEWQEKKILHERSLSRWREIAVDGLPGEEYKTKWVEFVDMREKFTELTFTARIVSWLTNMNEVFLREAFTHWRPIDLPTP